MSVNDDLEAALQPVKYMLAFYIGAMGAKSKNYYNDLFRRYGWEDEAEKIQGLFLGGQRTKAMSAVPDEYVDTANLIGTEGQGYIATPGIHSAEQIEGWKCVTKAVHIAGGPIVLQLWHVGRISHPSFQPAGALPVAPRPSPRMTVSLSSRDCSIRKMRSCLRRPE